MTINNLPEYASQYPFIVARECDGEWWFWGAYSSEADAEQAAWEMRGEIFPNEG